ncbi:MAG: pilin [bacterium]|nr:pilin [bacterium]
MLNNFLIKGHLLAMKLALATGETQEDPSVGKVPPDPNGCPLGTVCVPSNLPGAARDISLENVITNVINWGLGVAGTVAVLMFVVGGFLYVTASGDEKRIERGKSVVRSSITGIIIILLAAIIVNTINYALFRGGGPGPG